MTSPLDKVYHFFLWFTGFQKEEHISDMLARQKARLGIGWWSFPVLTFLILFWLFWHIATFKLKKVE